MNEMNPEQKEYPDLTEIWRGKEDRRAQLAKLPIEEKMRMLEKWRVAVGLIKSAKRIDLT